MQALLATLILAAPHWPRMGIHDGDNKLVWTSGCCEGDLVIIDFRDEQGDGNQGSGILTLNNSTNGAQLVYEIGPFWGLWKSFGPYCAPHGTHSPQAPNPKDPASVASAARFCADVKAYLLATDAQLRQNVS